MKKTYVWFVLAFVVSCYASLYAQTAKSQTPPDAGRNVQLPLKLMPALAGNYGELRPNHFHAGLDFKTQGSIGHRVYAFDDGYVARAVMNAWGYGNVLYIAHPRTGLMTVYAHLNAFNDSIAARVLQYQLEHEANNPDISFTPQDFPVEKGQFIAFSGNTGSSGGPHVHFEVRRLGADEYFDPMFYFINKIKDTTPPKIKNVYLYPLGGEACGSLSKMQSAQVLTAKNGAPSLNRKFTAWGNVGLALKAYDYMDGQSNIYGVKYVRLYQDDTLIFSFHETSYFYDERRYVNSLTDYAEWQNHRSMIMKSWREPGNKLGMIHTAVNDGIIHIDEERAYHFKYELCDAHGNKCQLSFVVEGVKPKVARSHEIPAQRVPFGQSYSVDSLGCAFQIPAGMLYTDEDIDFTCRPANYKSGKAVLKTVSPIYQIGRPDIPLHDYCTLRIEMPADMQDSSLYTSGNPYYIAYFHKGEQSPVETTLIRPADANGKYALMAQVRALGDYAIRKDVEGPTIVMMGAATYKKVLIDLIDKQSGVKKWRGTIDGHFVPFVMNAKGQVVANPSLLKDVIRPNKPHTIIMEAWDACGNKSQHDFVTTF